MNVKMNVRSHLNFYHLQVLVILMGIPQKKVGLSICYMNFCDGSHHCKNQPVIGTFPLASPQGSLMTA